MKEKNSMRNRISRNLTTVKGFSRTKRGRREKSEGQKEGRRALW